MAKEFKTIEDVLDFAIDAEQEAVDFYKKLSNQAQNQEMKRIFEQFAQEEIGHKARLIAIKSTGISDFVKSEVHDLKIADYLVSNEASPEMTYQEALVIAMKKEKAAFKLYLNLAAKTTDSELKSLFENLAIEESKHKLRFELEYDQYVLKEN